MIGYAVLGGFVLDAIFGDPAWLPPAQPWCCGGWDLVLPVINTFSRPLFTIPGTDRAP